MGNAGCDILTIFGEALECAAAADRAAYLDGACGGDAALRGRVEALLRAHEKAGGFLRGPSGPAERTAAEGPGTVFGPYTLVEPIGEGGFGVVYRAEQQQPVRRSVALKVLKPGMDGRQVIARFEVERQALALMDHPHIAKVLDAGEAPPAYAGGVPRPYFVMELVQGAPLTDFCDANRLTPRERLRLFVSVCQAVQHAHQKGIIHRDLKPSNIPVTLYDSTPVVKVIDFGIAKALDQRLTDKTLVTGVAQVIGTPLYMSPEQAEPGRLDIDTRSDIYSLGVLLYELLTGTLPFDKERLHQASFDEMRRILREEEPPRPSTRVSTLGPAAATLSEQRRTDPKQLGQLLRGELDWIVMKCLEKDRNRRYETASALGRDIEHYLADEAVEACPPSATYRLRKFLHKHRRPLLTGAAFLVLLGAGGVLAGWQAVREARVERDRAVEQAKRSAAVRDALDQTRTFREEARQERDAGKWARAREQAQRALALVESGPAEETLTAQVRQVQEELDEEEKDRRLVADLEAARLAQVETVASESRFALERAIPRYREAFRAYGLPVGEGDPAVAAARLRQRPPEVRQAMSAALDDWLGLAATPALRIQEPHLGWLRALAAAEADEGGMREMEAAWQERDPTQRRAALRRLAATADPRQWPAAMLTRLCRRLQVAGETSSAVELLQRAWRQYPADFWVNEELGLLVLQTQPQRAAEVVRYLTAAVALRPDTPFTHFALGNALRVAGQLDEAIACFEKAINLDPKFTNAHSYLGVVLASKRNMDGAIASFQKAIELDPTLAIIHTNLGVALGEKGDIDGAIASFRTAINLDPNDAKAHNGLGVGLMRKDQVDEAIACHRKAIDIDPKLAPAHTNLGFALGTKGDIDGAIASFRTAINLDLNDANAHNGLGAGLMRKDQLDEAIACYRKAIDIDPKLAQAYKNLGVALDAAGKRMEAITAWRTAVQLEPGLAGTHYWLGMALLLEGRASEALVHLNEAAKRLPAEQVRTVELRAKRSRAERLSGLEKRLPDLLTGKDHLGDNRERLDLIDLCRLQRRFAAAARFFTEAFAAEAKLADDLTAAHRYNAACAAALAATGQGEDAGKLDASERARLRERALDWLRADLALLGKQLDSGEPTARATVQQKLRQWQQDGDLVGIRDQAALDELPAHERKAFAQLWSDVAALLTKTELPMSQPDPRPEK